MRSSRRPGIAPIFRARGWSTLYDDYLVRAEADRWILDVEVGWSRIDLARAHADRDALDRIRDSALIESYFPVYTTALLRAFWDQVDVTAVFSIQLYESYKHFHALNRYLQLVGHRPVTDEEIVAVRERTRDRPIDDPLAELARYMISEHFAGYFFLRLSRQVAEPVLRELTGFIARDEFRHTQFAADLLEPRVRDDPSARERVLQAAADFRHIGADVVDTVPVSEKNDLPAILTLNRRMRRLCGESLSDYVRGALHVRRTA